MSIEPPPIQPSQYCTPPINHPLPESVFGHGGVPVGSIRLGPSPPTVGAVDGANAIGEIAARIDLQPMGVSLTSRSEGQRRAVCPVDEKVGAGMDLAGVHPIHAIPCSPAKGGRVPGFAGKQQGRTIGAGCQAWQPGSEGQNAHIRQPVTGLSGLPVFRMGERTGRCLSLIHI